MTSTQRLKIAIQKGGRLSQDSEQMLRQCGIRIHNGGSLRADAQNFPLQVYYLRDDDIPQYVSDGIVDAGIVGENVVLEKRPDLPVYRRLGFAKCRLSLAVRREEPYAGLHDLAGKRIATSYPVILEGFLKRHGVRADIEVISGSVEIAPGIGLADAICDLVSTGSTLLTNGLREVETVMRSEAVLVKRPELGAAAESVLADLAFRMDAYLKAREHKYILLNAPNDRVADICKELPGMRSPTILPLAESGWSSVHTVIAEDAFWERIDRIKALGAEGILVCPIEKMIL